MTVTIFVGREVGQGNAQVVATDRCNGCNGGINSDNGLWTREEEQDALSRTQ